MAEETHTPDTPPAYVYRSNQVHTFELEHYLKKHREANGVQPAPTPENLSGLCISGGGVRSATLGLGMLQAFIKAKKLKYFDYLSTVSGGGYIGACLSSLLSDEPPRRDKPKGNRKGEPIDNHNTKFDANAVGLEEHNSLFTHESYEYPKIETGKISTKHQLNHLRQHGEYLTPHKNIQDWDVHRLLGALFGGIVANVTTFLTLLTVLVLTHHVLLAWMSDDKFIETLRNPVTTVNQFQQERFDDAVRHYEQSANKAQKSPPKAEYYQRYAALDEVYSAEQWQKLSASEQLGAWAHYSFSPQLALVWVGVQKEWQLPLGFAILGFIFAILFIFWARQLPYNIARQEQEEQNFTGEKPNDRFYNRKGEEDMLDKMEQPIIRWFYHIGLWGIPLAAYIVTAVLNSQHNGAFNYFVMLALPLCYSLGLFLGLHVLIFLFVYNYGESLERVSGWIYRSFYTGLQGGAFLLVLITFLFPLAIILLFGGHGLAVKLSFSFIPVIVAYYFTMQSLGARAGGGGMLTTIISRVQTPLLNLSIFLFVGLTFAWISQWLYALELHLVLDWTPHFALCREWTRTDVVVCLFFVALAFLIFMGYVVNANDVSLHYFYRDRLSEAYLRTSGRVEVKTPGGTGNGDYKLLHINLRNHEDLQLRHLGGKTFRAPYHLIVAAINLQGSHDLSAKTQKSQHFLFSKYFIGSRATGYASTDLYQYGATKLSTAMAISGAAVSSGMGSLSFAASNFYLTLFNLRTGYWLNNPRHYIRDYKQNIRREEALKAKATQTDGKAKPTTVAKWTFWDEWKLRKSRLTQNYPFWLRYIWRELTGNLSATTQKINVSDGGHTGDNLGLLPLIQRRCSTIVVADFEADGTYSFDSFGQAVRLAKSIYDVDICIDLTKLMPHKNEAGEIFSPASVVEGTVTYHITETVVNPKTKETDTKFTQKVGQIIYMKSSVSLLKASSDDYDENVPPPPVAEPAPVMVLNYFKKNPQFPHQTTADQYFDEIQFEAYRMLGEHIGRQAAPKVVFAPLKTA